MTPSISHAEAVEQFLSVDKRCDIIAGDDVVLVPDFYFDGSVLLVDPSGVPVSKQTADIVDGWYGYEVTA